METARVFPAILLLLGLASRCQADPVPGFLLTLPRVLQAGSEESFCLTLHGLEQATAFTLVLTHASEDVEEEHQYSFLQGENQCQNFTVPSVPGFYDVDLENETGSISASYQSLQVEVRDQNLMTFVQTDKPLYKAGQLVKFRILTLRRDLRPRQGKIDSVYVKDPNDMRVKQWLALDSQGLYDLDFQLVEEPKLGTWVIEVTTEGATTTQTFKVDEYVLPKFEVKITPPSFLLANASTVEGLVCANYTYGKPVSGHLVLEVCLRGYGTFSKPCAQVVEEIEGCYRFSVNASLLTVHSSNFRLYGSKLSLAATVRERDTGSEVNETSVGPSVTFDPLTIKLEDDTNGYFKPAFPYIGRAKVTRPDGSPAEGEVIQVTVVDYTHDLRLSRNFTTDSQGLVRFAVCSHLTAETASFSVQAEAPLYAENHDEPLPGRLYQPREAETIKQWFSPSGSYVSIPPPRHSFQCGEDVELLVPYTALPGSNTTFFYQVLSRGRIMESGQVTAPFSEVPPAPLDPGLCLRQVVEPSPPPPEEPITEYDYDYLPPEPPVEPPVEPPTDQGLGEGDEEGRVPVEEEVIVPQRFNPLEIRRRREAGEAGTAKKEEEDGGDSEQQRISTFRLRLHLHADMAPTASLLLFHVRQDGETVADSVSFDVEPCFRNKVSMEFEEETVMPGQESSIRLQASPGSLCAVSVIDRSVNILGGDHQLTPAKVFDKLQSYSANAPAFQYSSDREYCERKMKEQERAAGGKTGEEARSYRGYGWFYHSTYVDALQAFKQSNVAVLTNLALETRPCTQGYPVYFDYAFSPRRNVENPLPMEVMPGPVGPVGPVPARVRTLGRPAPDPTPRQHFPETWLWELELVGSEEAVVLKRKAPDTITSWVGNSMCVSPEAGFGISNLTSLTTFQPFFLSFSLPYSAVRGERLPIRVSVFNYLDKCLNMQLRLDSTEAVEVHEEPRLPVCVCGGQAHTRRYFVTPRDLGNLPLTALAEVVPGDCGNDVAMATDYLGLTDAVRRQILVKAEGVVQEYVRSSYMCPKGSKLTETMDLPLPSDMVADSARGEVSVVGDIMGPALSNLDHLVQQPTGCGEQTMVIFTPIVHVLQYLTATNQLTEDIRTLATQYLEIGYQRELTFRHEDGSFSAFGQSDSSGSTWLTAFVVKSFAKARPFLYVDPAHLEQSFSFLRGVQLETGCWREVGRVLSSYMMGGLDGSGSDVALTAFVLASLLEANHSSNAQAVEQGFRCLERQDAPEDVYSRALLAYAHTLHDPAAPAAKRALKSLHQAAKKDGALRYWARETPLPEPVTSWYYRAAPSAEVEMTGYALLALLQGQDAVARGQPTALWLSKQRNAFGGFASTQDTVVGLQALAGFATEVYRDQQANVSVEVEGKNFSRVFHVQHGVNSLLTQTAPLTRLSNKLDVRAHGQGCVFVQASVRYNKLPDPPKPGQEAFRLSLAVHPHGNHCARRSLRICVSYNDRGMFSMGMSLVNLKLVTGWRPIQQSLKELRSFFPILSMKRFEHDEVKGELNFYFDEMDQRDRCFDVRLEQDQDLAVSDPKPAEVQAYQYYEKEVRVAVSYEIRTTCGTKQELPQEEPMVDEPVPAQSRQGLGRPSAFSVSRPQDVSCPVCSIETPNNFDEIVCSATHIYKITAGRSGKVPMKVKADLRPRRKQKLNLFVQSDLDESCSCFLVKPPKGKRVKRLLVLGRGELLQEEKLSLKAGTVLLSLDANRQLEKQARKAARSCDRQASRRRRP